jgi:predicted Zn-dependent protease
MVVQKRHIRRNVALAAAIGLTLAGCSNSIESAREEANTAQQRLAAGDLQGAREAIIRSISIRDDLVETQLLRGRIEIQSGRRAAAYAAYANALSLDATNGEALLAVAQLGLQTGHVDEADDAADKILALSPDQIDALTVKGVISLFRRNYDDAIGFADHILQIDPRNEGGTILKIRALILAGRMPEAEQLAEKSRGEVGLTQGLALTLLEIYREKSNSAGMLQMFETLRQANALTSELRLDEINLLYKLGQTDRARAQSMAYLAAFKQNRPALRFLSGLWQNSDPTPLSDADLARIAADGTLEQREIVAEYELEHGRTANAQRVLASVANGPWTDIRAINARVTDKLGNAAAASAVIAQILDADETNYHALLLDGQQHLRARRFDAAVNDAQILIREYPDRQQGYMALLDAYAAKDDQSGLSRVFADATEKLPQNLPLFTRYVDYLVAKGQPDRAVTMARLFARQTPALPAAWQLYARACTAAGDSICRTEAQRGEAVARTIYAIDLPPGAPRGLGLFGRLR